MPSHLFGLVEYGVLGVTLTPPGADMRNNTLALLQTSAELAVWVRVSALSPMVAILVIYMFLGCVMDRLAMVLPTIPMVYPAVRASKCMARPASTSACGSAFWR